MSIGIKQIIAWGLVVCGLALAGEKTALAARLLKATIDQNGQRVLESAYTDRGTEHPPQVWRYLGRAPGWTSVSKITAEANDPLRARIEGDVVIRIMHVDRPLVTVKASQLTLIRTAAARDGWYLSAEEIERIAGECGLTRPSLWDEYCWLLWPTMIGGAALVIAIVVLLFGWMTIYQKCISETVADNQPDDRPPSEVFESP